MEIGHTDRGFQIINFKDRYGEDCSLQQSSLADFEPPGSSAIWFGKGDERMQLDLEQVKELVLHLRMWIEDGKFDLTDPDAINVFIQSDERIK